MLLIFFLIAWLVVAILVLALCRTAARGDEKLASVAVAVRPPTPDSPATLQPAASEHVRNCA